ncbi:MAG: hypothetical protein RIF33_17000, partial [Cyclobacteriaceae bacterium]
MNHSGQNKEISFEIFGSRTSWKYSLKQLRITDLKQLLEQNTGIDPQDYFGFESNSNLDYVEIPILLKNIKPSESLGYPLVPFGKGFNRDLAQIYSDKIDKIKSVRQEFLKNMEVFIPGIERILVDTESGKILIEEVD